MDDGAPVLVAVLAGGAGRRLGGGKASVRLAGEPLISYPLAAASAAGLEAVVIAKPATTLPPPAQLRAAIIFEPATPIHPLLGLVTALRLAAPRPVLALGCDMPFVEPALLDWLARQEASVGTGCAAASSVVAAEVAGRLQPLLARYEQSSLPSLQAALRRQSALTATLAKLQARRIDERCLSRFGDPERLCFNVNDVEDLATAEAWLRGKASSTSRTSA